MADGVGHDAQARIATAVPHLIGHFYRGCRVIISTKIWSMKSLGADVVIDYKTEDFEKILSDYDLVLHSQDGKTLNKSLRVLKPGGSLFRFRARLIPISRRTWD